MNASADSSDSMLVLVDVNEDNSTIMRRVELNDIEV